MNSIDISAMPRRNPRRFRFPLRPLAAAFALAQMASTALAGVTHVVTTCDDAPVLPTCNGIDDGTLRQAFNCAQDGDTVDLTQLQCSTITLSAPLTSGPVGLTLSGPGAQYLTITANNQFRPLAHNGRPDDTMLIIGLTISNGSYDNPYTYRTGGGCIFSSGNVYLFGTEVTSCSTSATSAVATGGAIFAKGTVTLAASAVSGSTATGALADVKYAVACGGGIYADTVKVQSSVVSGNAAASQTGATYGGGVCATHFDAKYSTISENIATSRAGVAAGESFALTNSTISGNTARDFTGGAHLASGTAEIYNSTIAFNSAGAADGVGGITALAMHLESSIIARNTAAGVESDIGTLADGISGSHNLIMVSNVPGPADTIVDDPLLGPLQGNGGLTPTHALPVDSPAIDRGSNLQALEADQRLK
ncbi:MAG TPA: choice-of-anchor Q domain-containing protein, partial [Rudaea sp.]|nr:choice-of-anchor Q domain-containing protein [Rudaea sp.]